MEDENKPILYVLMRNDMPDYQPGKSMAQANHAGTAFCIDAGQTFDHDMGHFLMEPFLQWTQEANGFGTCIVLDCGYSDMLRRVEIARSYDLIAGVIHDPTYPIRDGHKIHTLPIDTCAYIFGGRIDCELATMGLPLFKG
jgi:hypothetical protein